MDLTLGMGLGYSSAAGVTGGGFGMTTDYGIDKCALEFPNRANGSSFGLGVDLSIGMGAPGSLDHHSHSHSQSSQPIRAGGALKSAYSSGFEARDEHGQTHVLGTNHGMNMSIAADYAMGANHQLNGSSSYGMMNTYTHVNSSYTPDSFSTQTPLESNLLMGVRSESDFPYPLQMSQIGLYSAYGQENGGGGGDGDVQHLPLNNSRIDSMTPSYV